MNLDLSPAHTGSDVSISHDEFKEQEERAMETVNFWRRLRGVPPLAGDVSNFGQGVAARACSSFT